MSDTSLPTQFADLQQFDTWLLRTEAERINARLHRPFRESEIFYAAMFGEIPRILTYLEQHTGSSADQHDRNLLALTLAYIEVANAVELYHQSEIPDGANLELFVSTLDTPV